MPPCCPLPAVPARLPTLLALLLAKRVFRRGPLSSGGWSWLHRQALRREKTMSSPGDKPLLMGSGGHPLFGEGLEPQLRDSGCRFPVLETVPVAAGGNAPSAQRVIRQCDAGTSRIHAFSALVVSDTRVRRMRTCTQGKDHK